MSSSVIVNIEAPNSMFLEGAELPDDYTVDEVINDLIDNLDLPRVSDMGAPVDYVLYFVNRQQNLMPYQTVATAGIRDGDLLRLKAPPGLYVPPAPVSVPPTMPPTNLPPDEWLVVLSVLDINKHDTVSLPLGRSVGELIRQIVQNYKLPARDKFGQLM